MCIVLFKLSQQYVSVKRFCPRGLVLSEPKIQTLTQIYYLGKKLWDNPRQVVMFTLCFHKTALPGNGDATGRWEKVVYKKQRDEQNRTCVSPATLQQQNVFLLSGNKYFFFPLFFVYVLFSLVSKRLGHARSAIEDVWIASCPRWIDTLSHRFVLGHMNNREQNN